MAEKLKVLICGGGCAGPSLAFWLARSSHHVTVVERFPALRASGAQIDIRAQGIQVIKRMGLLDTIRSKLVDEAGVSLVDSQGNVKATIMANKSGQGAQSLTSEYEIMRGDLVRILYDATRDNVQYVFGKTVERFEQDEEGVTVHFSDGQTSKFDVLVGADGQGSRIRQAILPYDDPDPLRRFGLYMGYWVVPRSESDNNIRKVYNAPNSRMIMCRTHSPNESQAYLSFKDDSKELRSVSKAPVETQKEFWAQKFQGAGWQTDRFIKGMETTDNFYCQEVVQVRTDTWSKGRVVLLADAAHCPSPMSGMGTTSAFAGAYVLAGEINRNSQDLPLAFANYDKTMRPFVNEIQKLNPFLLRLGYPKTTFGIAVIHFIAGLVSFFRIPDLISRFSREEKGGWSLPEYPGMNVS
ncbi:MAG: hypothetical protein M1820_006875 [Bogoriella megaspora]|nr:MAG: hypothetical protein M1820_006875 [Bogoriella megaspora]